MGAKSGRAPCSEFFNLGEPNVIAISSDLARPGSAWHKFFLCSTMRALMRVFGLKEIAANRDHDIHVAALDKIAADSGLLAIRA
jgi:hypothetical protein